jgi:hypothetical protein
VDGAAVEAEWSGVCRTIRAGMLAVPSRAGARLPHLTHHDIAELDLEIRATLTELGSGEGPLAEARAPRYEGAATRVAGTALPGGRIAINDLWKGRVAPARP